jgi:hypothetical protein
MKSLKVLIVLLLMSAAASASADEFGTLYVDGKPLALKDAYAYTHPNTFDKTKQTTTIAFTDAAIDKAEANAATDRERVLHHQVGTKFTTLVELNLDADGGIDNVNTLDGHGSSSVSGSGWYDLKIKRNDGKRVEGSFLSTDKEKRTKGTFYDLRFALDIAGAPSLGTPLGADGGDPGKAYRAYNAALVKGDLDALSKLMTKSRSDEILSHRNDPQFKAMFGFIRQSALRNPKIGKGFVNGDKATLEVSGKDGDGNATDGTATLLKEGGAWRLAEESMTTHSH